MKKLLLLVILFSSINSFSQEAVTIKLDSLFYGIKTVDTLNFYVKDVIDNRLYNEYIGIAQYGIYNYTVPIKFESSLKNELGDFFKRMFPFKNSKIPVTIRVNDLFIKEDPKFLVEVGDLNFQFDVLKKESEGLYSLIGSYSITSKRNTLDATSGNIGHLAGILYKSISLISTKIDVSKTGRLIKLAYKEEPTILTNKPNLGFYKTYAELANNFPDIDLKFSIKEKSKNKGSNTIEITDANEMPCDYFSYFDGEHFYLNSSFYNNSDYFIKTYRIDNFLLFTEDFIADDYITAYTIAKGRSGYKYVKTRRPIIFNLADGKFYPVRRDKMARLLEEKYPDLYKKFKKNEKKDIQETYEIIKFLFEKEDVKWIRERLAN